MGGDDVTEYDPHAYAYGQLIVAPMAPPTNGPPTNATLFVPPLPPGVNNPLTKAPFRWVDKVNYGSLDANLLSFPPDYGQLAQGDEPASDFIWAWPEQNFLAQFYGYGYSVAHQADGRLWRLAIKDSRGAVVRATAPTYKEPGNFFRDVVVPFASFAITAGMLGGFSLSGKLGSMIVGETLAATYPALTTAIGNTAISTALNGGDVAGAVKSVALGAVGGQAGSFVGSTVASATGLDLLGKLSSAVTAAAIKGTDPSMAVGALLFQAGASSLADLFTEPPIDFGVTADPIPVYDEPLTQPIEGDTAMDYTDLDTGLSFGDFTFGDLVTEPDTASTITNWGGVWDGSAPLVFDGFASDPSPFGDSFGPIDYDFAGGFDALAQPLPDGIGYDMGPTLWPTTATAPQAPDISTSVFNPTDLVSSITQAAQVALSLVNAYRQINAPAQTQARVVMPNGTIKATTSDGFVQSKTATGQVTKSKPPVGQAMTTIDGYVIVNNGDGTYTRIDPNGTRQVLPYPPVTAGAAMGSLGGIDPKILMIGGAAILGVLALSRGRK